MYLQLFVIKIYHFQIKKQRKTYFLALSLHFIITNYKFYKILILQVINIIDSRMMNQGPIIRFSYNPDNQYNQSKTLRHFQSCMLLAAIGDVIGYRCGKWQFCYDTKKIHDQMMELTKNQGISALDIKDWIYSDDTVMHIATAEALLKTNITDSNEEIIRIIAVQYKASWKKMKGRGPGKTTGQALAIIKQNGLNWKEIPYNQKGWGCGGSMRSACIGLAFYRDQDLNRLIQLSIQSGRITHHNPIGFLGSLMSSYFTALAIKRIPIKKWMFHFKNYALESALAYVKQSKRYVKQNTGKEWTLFVDQVQKYCKARRLSFNKEDQQDRYELVNLKDFKIRDQEFSKHSPSSQKPWPGSIGLDSALIAYDCLLHCGGSWQKLVNFSMLHGGDSDSTGTIAGAWFGAFYGIDNKVPTNQLVDLQKGFYIRNLGRDMFYKFSKKDPKYIKQLSLKYKKLASQKDPQKYQQIYYSQINQAQIKEQNCIVM